MSNQEFTRKIRSKKKLALFITTALVLALGFYGYFIEPNLIEVKHLWIKDPGLDKALEGKIAIHLSDLHIRHIGSREHKVLKIVDELKPDFIFLTGDYVTWKGDYEPALSFLSRLEARIGVWAVMGDYDYSNSRKSCLLCHEKGTGKPNNKHQIKFLRNEFERAEFQDGSVWIGGVDYENHKSDEERNKIKLPEGIGAAIILCHNPLPFDSVDREQDVLLLSGDTHGGQVPIPGWLWNILGYEKTARYSHGLYEKGVAKMYVSRGVGTSHMPIRILRRPEVVVLHFK